jgi:hypothetical protein
MKTTRGWIGILALLLLCGDVSGQVAKLREAVLGARPEEVT